MRLLHDRGVIPIDLSPLLNILAFRIGTKRYLKHSSFTWKQGSRPTRCIGRTTCHRERTPRPQAYLRSRSQSKWPVPLRPSSTFLERLLWSSPVAGGPSESCDIRVGLWPRDRTASRFWQGTLECADAILEDVITLEPIHQLQFFYEWNWRFERCLVPITSAMSQAIGNTLSKMNPFAETVQFANLRVSSAGRTNR